MPVSSPAFIVPPPPFALRPMRLADLEAVMAIEQVAHISPWHIDGYRYELTENKLAWYHVLTHRQAVIAYDGYWLMGDECHISTLSVHPDWQGQGCGTCLLLNSLALAYQQGARLATLEVRQSNRAAQALYQKFGFETMGLRRRYYKDEDALIMTLAPLDQGQLARWRAAWTAVRQRWQARAQP